MRKNHQYIAKPDVTWTNADWAEYMKIPASVRTAMFPDAEPSQGKMRLRTAIIVGFSSVIVLGTVSGFAICVWPTLYRYDQVKLNDYVFPVRMNRISGETELFEGDNWQPAVKNKSSEPTIMPLPQDEVAKLQGDRAEFYSLDNSLRCNIYNGGAYRVKEVVVHVQVTDGNLTVVDRDYRVTSYGYIEPLQGETLQAPAGFVPANGQKWTWFIRGASGIKP